MEKFDVIIGGDIAGLSAALILGRSCWLLSFVITVSPLIENDQKLGSMPKTMESLIAQGFHLSERRDLNPRPLLPQSSALPSCATPRQN